MRYCFMFSVTLLACANSDGIGDVGYACYSNGTCNEGLVCLEGICRVPAFDAGPPIDAGMTRDAGMDATIAVDGGSDAGMDAGVDAGMTPDAGVIEGPLDHALPANTRMTTVTRLGQDVFILAYVSATDGSTPESDQLGLQRVRRFGHALVFDPPTTLTEATIDPGSDNPIHLAGAIGSEHFFVILMRPGRSPVLRFFADRGGSFVDLGSTPLAVGSLFAAEPMHFQAHPVDDTRHILGYREGNSGMPIQYRLLVRDGDTLRFGAPTSRPAPSAFTGLATGEPQAEPALFRVGPTTFVEARAGYVYDPGYLSSWTLQVQPDETLVASAPTVHATVTRTMIPEVAADGRGGAVIAYFGYGTLDWYYGMYDHSTRTLEQQGILGTSQTSPLRAHQGESTDRFLGGYYYLRLVGGPDVDAPLFRIAPDGTAERLADVPQMWRCYRGPQMVRAGTIAAYHDCARVRFVDLMPLCGNGSIDAGEECDDGGNFDGDGCTAGCTNEPL